MRSSYAGSTQRYTFRPAASVRQMMPTRFDVGGSKKSLTIDAASLWNLARTAASPQMVISLSFTGRCRSR